MADDSPLSITASVAGILTFLAAVLAASWLRLDAVRRAQNELFSLKGTLERYDEERKIIEKTHRFKHRIMVPGVADLGNVLNRAQLEGIRLDAMKSCPDVANWSSPGFTDTALAECQSLDLEICCLFVEAWLGTRDLQEFVDLYQHFTMPKGFEYWTWEVHPRLQNRLWALHPSIGELPFHSLKRGYAMRWLRLRAKVDDLVKRRETLSSNRILRLLLQNENRMLESEAQSKKQQEMIEDIWNAMKAKGEIVEGSKEVDEEYEPSTDRILNAIETVETQDEIEPVNTQTYLGLHPQLRPGPPPEGALSNPYWAT